MSEYGLFTELVKEGGSIVALSTVLLLLFRHMKEVLKNQRDDFLKALDRLEIKHSESIEIHKEFFSEHTKKIDNVCSEIKHTLGRSSCTHVPVSLVVLNRL